MIIQDALLTTSVVHVIMTEFAQTAVDPSRVYLIQEDDSRIELILEEITQSKYEHY